MGYMPRDRTEEDALDMYRVIGIAGRVLLELGKIVGKDCRLHPDLTHSMAALRDALADLESDAEGLLRSLDPERALEKTARVESAAALLARAKEILTPPSGR